MAPCDKAYTKEMRKVFEASPDDLEVRAVFAESIMNETPWQIWDPRAGKVPMGRARKSAGRSWSVPSARCRQRGVTRASCTSTST
jgi:hypothetical protein